MQLVEMRTSLRSKIGNPTVGDVADLTLDGHINSAYLDIAGRFRFHKARKRCTFLTVQSQPRYDLPSDVLVVLRLSDTTNHVKLDKWGDRQLSSRPNPDLLGKPLHYVRYRDWVELDPVPDYGNGTTTGYLMEVYYKFFLTKLTLDIDTPAIPPSWHEGIVRFAKYYYYDDVGDLPKATMAYEAWKLWLSDKPTEIDEESVDIDSAVDVLSLSQSTDPRLDFDHAD